MERLEHWPWAGELALPDGLAGARLWRWCVLRTLRELRLAHARGRWIGRASLERRFARRWAEADPEVDHEVLHRMKEQHGRVLIRRAWNGTKRVHVR